VILFLDGHGSQWNKYALKFLLDNKVFPFFLASHTTSIWSWPNDVRVNKRFHWAIKQAIKEVQHTMNVPIIQYCNSTFVNEWCCFLKSEHNISKVCGSTTLQMPFSGKACTYTIHFQKPGPMLMTQLAKHNLWIKGLITKLSKGSGLYEKGPGLYEKGPRLD